MDEGSITEEVSSSSTQVVDELSSEGEAASSLAEKLETPKFVMDALQWAQYYRIAFSAIAKLLAIAEGRYVLQEGEDPPNLHGAYEQLHANLGSLDIPEDDTDLQKMAEELDAELGEIIAKLSVPPTTSELTVANEEREVLRSQIDAFYQRIQFERNSS